VDGASGERTTNQAPVVVLDVSVGIRILGWSQDVCASQVVGRQCYGMEGVIGQCVLR
jgi:hypothetical protein